MINLRRWFINLMIITNFLNDYTLVWDMSAVKSIYRSLLFLSSGEIISKILQFVLMVYAARILDQASFGKFSFAISLSFIAIITADLGINHLLIREISRYKICSLLNLDFHNHIYFHRLILLSFQGI